jgi:hypothetical protein
MNKLYDPPLHPGDVGYIPTSTEGDDLSCLAVYTGLFCTEPPNHQGPHLAHGLTGSLYAVWDEEEPS